MLLRDYLAQNKITKYRAAKILGVSWTTVWRWCTGRSVPQQDQMRGIEKLTGGQVTWSDFGK